MVSSQRRTCWSTTLKATIGLLLSLGLLGGAVGHPRANLLLNGSFEDGPSLGTAPFIDLPAGATAIVGWTVGGFHIDYAGPGTWTISDGVRSVDLDGSAGLPVNGAIAQTFVTTPGQHYRVTFDLSGNSAGLPLLKQVEVTAGAESQVFTYDIGAVVPPVIPLTLTYIPQTLHFTATGSSTTLVFTSLTFQMGDSGFGPIIDNVEAVEEVPIAGESVTWSAIKRLWPVPR
jgi:choice-of-anchor C domain-containing protein